MTPQPTGPRQRAATDAKAAHDGGIPFDAEADLRGPVDRHGRRILTHGYGGYARGCRCAQCARAKRAYVAERRAAGGEVRYAARRPAWSQDARTSRTRIGVARVQLSGVTHGTTGYRTGCRCWDCTDAASASSANRRSV